MEKKQIDESKYELDLEFIRKCGFVQQTPEEEAEMKRWDALPWEAKKKKNGSGK